MRGEEKERGKERGKVRKEVREGRKEGREGGGVMMWEGNVCGIFEGLQSTRA